jgi:hypothetical protein
MTTPARDDALAEHEQGTGSRRAGPQHLQPLAPVEAAALIARLRQRVRIWVDGDRVLPADGSCLPTTLEQALAGLTQADARTARAGIERFVGQVQALVEAGVLEISDAHSTIETGALLIARLSSAGAAETRHTDG